MLNHFTFQVTIFAGLLSLALLRAIALKKAALRAKVALRSAESLLRGSTH
jgi:hypothetical protein